MKNKLALPLVMAAAASAAVPASSQEAVNELETIIVYGTRTISEATRDTISINTIDLSGSSTSDIYEATQGAAGLNVVRSGARGQITSVFTRGTDSDQTGLSLNGVSIIDSSTPNSAIDLGIHSLVGIGSIEVMRGPQSVMYGSGSIGGNINLNSTPTLGSSISQTFGSNGLSITNLTIGEVVGDRTIVNLELEKESRDGPSALVAGTEDDPFESTGFALSQETELDNGFVFFTGIIQNKNDISYDGTTGEEEYTGDVTFQNLQTSLTSDNTRIVLNRAIHDRQYTEPYAASQWAPAGLRTAEYDSVVNTAQAEHTMNVLPSLDLTFGGEIKDSEGKFVSAYGDRLNATRLERGVYGTLSYSINQDVLVTGSVRLDDSDDFGMHDSTRIGIGAYGFRASYSNGYRLPSLYEMHGQGAWVSGNPNLNPETSQSIEIGYGNDMFDISAYRIMTNNTINADYANGTYINSDGEEESYGAELVTNHTLGMLTINNVIGYNRSFDADGEQRLRRPEWMHTLKVSTEVGETNVYGTMNYFGAHTDYNWPNAIDVDAVRTFNIGANRDFGNVRVSARVDNITDVKYERPFGYGQDGRVFSLTGTYKF